MSNRVEVVRGSPELAGPGKLFGGQRIFDAPGSQVGLTRLSPGAVTPWHHHGACEFYGYVVQGTVTLEFGPGGKNAEHVGAGHFLRIPPRLVHRDLNPTSEIVLVATVCVGENPTSVVVETPDS